MQDIRITELLAEKVPDLELYCIECGVSIEEKNEGLWQNILLKISELADSLLIEKISKMPAVAASRKAYKACGKDPARYRLSAEALLRRVIKRRELYQVNNVVDLLNLVSLSTGFSIGGYDADKINGRIEFGIGIENEPYKGIGRGDLNIGGMPVFRDEIGAFGTSTSDSVRTSVTNNTKRFLMVIVNYGNTGKLNEAGDMACELLENYASATALEIKSVKI